MISLWSILDKIDCSYAYVRDHWKAILGVIIGLISLIAFRILAYWLFCTGGIEKVVKYLISGSARHVDSAISLRSSNILQAYEHAIYGSVMAQTAKDLVDNKKNLSRELDVDVYAYLDYTNQVLSQIKNSIKH